MNIQQDFKELLALLEENQVDYMVVGGYAVAFHGFPRFTKDLDIFFSNSLDNIERIFGALCKFGFSRDSLSVDNFLEEGNIITFGVVPVRVDFINTIDGVTYKEAKAGCMRGKYSNIEVNFIGKKELTKNKKSTNRTQDKADVEKLS